jgi:hypothetical protein
MSGLKRFSLLSLCLLFLASEIPKRELKEPRSKELSKASQKGDLLEVIRLINRMSIKRLKQGLHHKDRREKVLYIYAIRFVSHPWRLIKDLIFYVNSRDRQIAVLAMDTIYQIVSKLKPGFYLEPQIIKVLSQTILQIKRDPQKEPSIRAQATMIHYLVHKLP